MMLMQSLDLQEDRDQAAYDPEYDLAMEKLVGILLAINASVKKKGEN